jgi:hypothetical protein
VAVIGLAVTSFLSCVPISCVDTLCANEQLSEHPSPDGKLTAVVFERDCGAATGFSTQASLLRAGEPLPNQSGNIFTADTGAGAAPSGPGGGPVVLVRWTDASHLVLQYHPRARVFHAASRGCGIEITHEAFW